LEIDRRGGVWSGIACADQPPTAGLKLKTKDVPVRFTPAVASICGVSSSESPQITLAPDEIARSEILDASV